MTLEYLSNGSKINLEEVYKKLNLPTSIPKDTKLKDISNTIPDFEVEGAREIFK